MVETRKQRKKLEEQEKVKQQNFAAGDAQVLKKPSKLSKDIKINEKFSDKQKNDLATKAIENVVDKAGNNECGQPSIIKKFNDLTELNEINDNFIKNARCKEDNIDVFNSSTIYQLEVGKKLGCSITKSEYRIICKIGHGGFSIVWLVFDIKNKIFKAAKVLLVNHCIPRIEQEALLKIGDHPNILRYYESFKLMFNGGFSYMVIYESLGMDLNKLLKQHGVSVRVIKRLASDMLNALKTIHSKKINIVHSDIKPDNIALSISQKSIYGQIQSILKSKKSLSAYKMINTKCSAFEDKEKKKAISESLSSMTPSTEEHESLSFKLIDFGNAVWTGECVQTGTIGYRPPESCFQASLKSSHDIWSLGVILFECFTGKKFFSSNFTMNAFESEINSLKNIFGKFPRHLYPGDPFGLKKKYTVQNYDSVKQEERTKKKLQKKLNCWKRTKEESEEFLDFLLHLLKVVPKERWSAEELLFHPWLNDTL